LAELNSSFYFKNKRKNLFFQKQLKVGEIITNHYGFLKKFSALLVLTEAVIFVDYPPKKPRIKQQL